MIELVAVLAVVGLAYALWSSASRRRPACTLVPGGHNVDAR